MKLKDQIMALHRKGKTTRQIAERVYNLEPDQMGWAIDKYMAYVRVVIRQRKNNGQSPADQRYMANGGLEKSLLARRVRYATDEAYRARELDRAREWRLRNPEYFSNYWKQKAKAA